MLRRRDQQPFSAAGQEAGRNASLPDPIAPHFWHLERLEQVHGNPVLTISRRWRSYNPVPKSLDQQMLADRKVDWHTTIRRKRQPA